MNIMGATRNGGIGARGMTVSGVVSNFSASKAITFFDTFHMFSGGEF